jgi:hypothetical protein
VQDHPARSIEAVLASVKFGDWRSANPAGSLGGLASKKRGRASNRRMDETVCTMATELIGTHYRDFGPSRANEKLAERHDMQLSVESTRQLMIKTGY